MTDTSMTDTNPALADGDGLRRDREMVDDVEEVRDEPRPNGPDEFSVGDNNKPLPTQHNIRVALLKLGVTLRYDRFQMRPVIDGLDDCGPYLEDSAIRRLWLNIERQFLFRPSKEYFWDVILDEAFRNGFHPVRHYLDSLTWDGVHRLDGWLTTYCGAEANEYTRAVGTLMLVAAVRRVREPGCKFDEMPVLEGPQGDGKSSLLQKLAVRQEWFLDDMPLNADAQKTIERLSGRWIVEAAELNGIRKGEIEHVKSFLSRTVDHARMAYGRLPLVAPRQCIVVGTTNNDAYLRDATGNRRFWPIVTTRFDLEAFDRDRDQLWAEAVVREATGASIRLSRELWPSAAEEQEKRVIREPWIDVLGDALGDLKGKVKTEDIWHCVLHIPAERRHQGHHERIGVAMKTLGWERKKLRFGETRKSWGYCKGPHPHLRILFQDGAPYHEGDEAPM